MGIHAVNKRRKLRPQVVTLSKRDPLAEALLRIADAASPRLRKAVLAALQLLSADFEDEVQLARLLAARRLRDIERRLEPASFQAMQFAVENTIQEVATRSIQATMRGSSLRATIPLAFNQANPEAVAWAFNHSSKLIQGISDESIEAVREIVGRGFIRGDAPIKMAREIRDVVGLTRRQAVGIDNLRQAMVRDGLSQTVIDKRIKRATARKLNIRAKMIARTETINASVAGQREVWNQAIDNGQIKKESVLRRWSANLDDRVDPDCEALHGEQIRYDEFFSFGDPPIHPNCRCSIILVPADPDAKISTMTDTMTRHTDANGKWTPERVRLHDRIERDILKGATPVDDPTVYMLGGGPASGKSSVLDAGKLTHPGNAATIDSDAIKKFLPEFDIGTRRRDPGAAFLAHEESSYLSKRIMRTAQERQYNIILDGTGNSNFEKLVGKVAGYRADGHRVIADYMTIDTDLSWTIAKNRAEKTGRFVPEEVVRGTHQSISEMFPKALDQNLFDEVRLWDNNLRDNPRLILEQVGDALRMDSPDLYDDFLAKAVRIEELPEVPTGVTGFSIDATFVGAR